MRYFMNKEKNELKYVMLHLKRLYFKIYFKSILLLVKNIFIHNYFFLIF